ncbi:MAG: M14 family metallopeptidase, partial [Cyclobacteriaceae bacterium]
DHLVAYMQTLDQASDRIVLEVTGYTHEARPLLLLTITSSQNHQNLETLRRQHIALTDPTKSGALNTKLMPVVFYLGCSIHGNEASGSNAALLMAYHFAAAQGPEIEKALENTIILLDPSFNPDGLQRFSTWVNANKSKAISPDANDMEHHEPWPGGRTNHYWFDLNRDWLVAQQPESQARLKKFHQWKPNVLTDHHEMGTNSTFFFQPGVPSRSHPITPPKNQELTRKMGEFHALALDKIGSLYYTQEGYDDYYYGKGSTFPDAQGAVGILFEQASSRGHAQESANGLLRFPFTIRNQFTTAMSSLKAVNALREDLLNYQRQFFLDAAVESNKDPVKALIFGSRQDKARVHFLTELLTRHEITFHKPKNDQTINGKMFEAESSFIIPMNQLQYKLLKAMFEKRTQFQDSLFYDISSWTLSLATGVDFEEIKTTPPLGNKVTENKFPSGKLMDGTSQYAYVFETYGYFAPRAIYRLLKQGIRIKVANDPFNHANGKKFERGAIMVPLNIQEKGQQQIDSLINEIIQKDGIDVYAFHSGLDYDGSSLGSESFQTLRKPDIAMLVNDGVSASGAGEMWHLFDTRFEIPVTMIPVGVFNTANLSRYNTLIFPPGTYGTITDAAKERLKAWTQSGGVLIGLESAINWFQAAGFGTFNVKKDEGIAANGNTTSRAYSDIEEFTGAQKTSGAIFEATVDLSHPLLYGYSQKKMSLFKGNNLFLEKSANVYGNPLVYTATPLMSGYISKQNLAKVKESSIAGISALGSGRVIGFTENLAFRAFWVGTNKLLMNAIFFGSLIDPATAR